MDRRAFLTAIGCSAAASPLLAPVAFANAPWDNRLVVVILRGAMDGLDAFRPMGDRNYAALRPTLNDGGALKVDDFWGLHPALAPLMPLWNAGQFGVVPAVSTPYRDKRSHFDGQDLLEAGGTKLDGSVNDGWLNRLIQTVPGAQSELSYAIGRDPMGILAGKAPASRWSPEARLRISPQAQRLLELVTQDDPLFHAAAADAIKIAAQVQEAAQGDAELADSMADNAMMGGQVPRGTHAAVARFAAARLRGASRIASFSVNGWDTHLNQRHGIARALGQLSDTLLTLRVGLGDVWDKTAVLCITEFGRTARENGTKGTDHGTGGAMFYAGGALRGARVAGEWPGLAEADLYDRRDLMPTADVRSMAGWVMRDLFGVDRSLIENTIFPKSDLGSRPSFLL